ncbi:MAG: alanine--tRNA ligase, partial [Myxococcales bacterium]|nr:alanine--tRNA ligase [Myxococcales bacterium]
RHGVLLGMDRPFLYEVSGAVVDEMGEAYPELVDRRAYIADRVRREEERFVETLSKGLALLEGEIATVAQSGARELPGEVVFKLYDTYGFPTDLTEDIARGHNVTLDEEGFRREMATQRERSREAWKGSGDALVSEVYGRIASDLVTSFRGYDSLVGESEVQALLRDGAPVAEAAEGQDVEVIVSETPFYPESGGQVGDRGTLQSDAAEVVVEDTLRPVEGLIVHRGRVTSGTLKVGDPVHLAVDSAARAATVRNHSGTHLLHAALRRVLGEQAMQKGSLVSPDRLRFDFTHDAPLSLSERERIEDLVNEWIEDNADATVRQMAYKEAIGAGAVAIFEEKYGDEVRVVSFGDVSTELCGGTHAGATGDIGLLKIVSETGIAAGVRRVEALTGLSALEYLREQEAGLRRIGELLRVPPAEAAQRVEKLLEERRLLERELEAVRSERRGAASKDLLDDVREVGGVRVLAARVEGAGGKELRGMVDDLRARLGSGVVLLAAEKGGNASLALGVTPDLTERLRAGDLVREIARVLGGKGGGRPDFAQAGGPDATKLDEAFQKLDQLVSAK